MEQTKSKEKNIVFRLFRLCPIRHCICAFFALMIALYFLFRNDKLLMLSISEKLVQPWHHLCSRLCSAFSFSVCELIIVLAIIGGVVYIIFSLAQMIRNGRAASGLYKLAVTITMIFCVIYGGFCVLWGVYYYSSDFEEQSGIYAEPVSDQQLLTVTRYFTVKLNSYADAVSRDENGVFNEEMNAIFDHSSVLYNSVCDVFPCLEGDQLRVKPFFFSEILSRISFTGFFFPFTGEANINIASPSCLIPSTIAHEIAHQRGIAEEDEANFVGILACLEDGDPVYCYSACLLAYIHLSNALYKTDREAWSENYETLSTGVIADLKANNAYWAKYENSVAEKASNAVYTGFLQSYGQEQGLKTYGACIDLLIAYYYTQAEMEVN